MENKDLLLSEEAIVVICLSKKVFQDRLGEKMILAKEIAQAQLFKVLKAGYLSPEEVEAKIKAKNQDYWQSAKRAIEEEAKQQERERMIQNIEEHFKKVGYQSEEEYNWWQALKLKRA